MNKQSLIENNCAIFGCLLIALSFFLPLLVSGFTQNWWWLLLYLLSPTICESGNCLCTCAYYFSEKYYKIEKKEIKL